jgi:hypothetical protein
MALRRSDCSAWWSACCKRKVTRQIFEQKTKMPRQIPGHFFVTGRDLL